MKASLVGLGLPLLPDYRVEITAEATSAREMSIVLRRPLRNQTTFRSSNCQLTPWVSALLVMGCIISQIYFSLDSSLLFLSSRRWCHRCQIGFWLMVEMNNRRGQSQQF
jgi:hypothetical protein